MKPDRLLFFLIALVVIIFYPSWVVDDAAIIFRYADNFRIYQELNWNPGEPLEGYTGIVLLMLLVVSSLSFLTTAHIIGVVGYLAGAAALYLLVSDKYTRWILMPVYLIAPALMTHIYSGLETTLFISLVLMALYFYRKRMPVYSTVFFILLSLCRPEGILISVLLLLSLKNKKATLWYVSTLGIYFIWKYFYYDSLLPNSFYHKGIDGNNLSLNMDLFKEFSLIYLLVPTTIIIYGVIKKCFHSKGALGVLLAISALLIYYLQCRLQMNYSYRFFFHVFPLILFLAGMVRINKRTALMLIAVVLILYAYALPAEIKYIKEEKYIIAGITETGNYIKENYPPESKICVYQDAGFIPYLTKMKTLDLGGLMSKRLAVYESKERDKKYSWDMQRAVNIFYNKREMFFNFDPDLFVSYSTDSVFKADVFMLTMLTDDRFSKYRFVRRFGNPKYCQFLFAKNNLKELP